MGAVEVHISGTERTTTTYYFAGGQRIAMREGVTVTYLHGDHLGSASLATDASGAQVSEMRYTPFGEIRYGDAPTDRRFTGQREESGIGLYDYGARFYSQSLGRFVSADTVVPDLRNPQALNRYSYVVNNPLRFNDPTGQWWEDPETGALMPGYSPETLPEAWKEGRTSYKYPSTAEPPVIRPTIYSLPVVNGRITQWYGGTRAARGATGANNNYNGYGQGFHPGLDWGGMNWNSRVYSGIYGRVVQTWPPGSPAHFGKYRVDIRHGNWCIIIGHMSNDVQVTKGQYVIPTTVIGGVGNQTGNPRNGNIHIHWEFRYAPKTVPINANCSHAGFSEIHNPLEYMLATDYARLQKGVDFGTQFHPDNPFGNNPLNQPTLKRGGKLLW